MFNKFIHFVVKICSLKKYLIKCIDINFVLPNE